MDRLSFHDPVSRAFRQSQTFFHSVLIVVLLVGMLLPPAASVYAAAALTVTPLTWNLVGLDSNNPAIGPNRFPVGARVCNTGDTIATNVVVSFVWDDGRDLYTGDPYINLRAGSLSSMTVPSIAPGSCYDAYFEAQVTRTALAFDKTRRYHITATASPGVTGVSPIPRELYVEHLISQNRNSVTNVALNGVSIPAGGTMTLMVGNTYTITLYGGTATQGYNNYEQFVNFPNHIFQTLAVNTSYSADNSPYVPNPDSKLYADACLWDNDPNSPLYRQCVGGDYKAGGINVVTTYVVKIVGGAGTSAILNTLLYDFSGSSYHYNSDYSISARIANIVDASNVGFSKSFSPDPITVNGVSALTITVTNPNPGTISGYNFTDTFPVSMMVANPPGATTTGCGTPTFAPTAGAGTITFTNGTVAPNSSCVIKVNVTVAATGVLTNTTNHLFVDTLDTGKVATATLNVNTAPPTPAPTCDLILAQWTMTTTQGTAVPPQYSFRAADVMTATANFFGGATGGAQAINTTDGNPPYSWEGSGFQKGVIYTATTAPYFELTVDSSKYTGLSITLDSYATANWGDNNVLRIWSSADGGTFGSTTPPTGTLAKTTWFTNQIFTAGASGSTTTTFRINADGANPSGAAMLLDNITLRGCAVPQAPTLSKTFVPNPVAVGAASALSFTITNPDLRVPLSGITFSDTLPSGVTVTSGSASACGGTLTRIAPSTLSFSGGTLAAGGTCTITATVTATTAGPHLNVSGVISATESGPNTTPNGYATASLTAVLPPSIAKLFSPNPILAGGVATSTLTLVLTNPNQNDVLSGVAFTDTFPASPGNMVVAPVPNASTSGCGTPTFTANAGSGTIIFTNGTIAGGATCTVKVDVTVPTAGTYTNTTGYVSHIINSTPVNGNTATDSLTATTPHPAISILKQVGPSASGPWNTFLALSIGGSVWYRFTVENTGDVPLSPVSVSDPALAGNLADPAGCTWVDPLPVASPTQDPTSVCIRGPIVAASGSYSNTAMAQGTYTPTTTLVNSNPSTATYATTGLSLTKSVTETYFSVAGDILHYSYVVTNTGFAPLAGPVTIADDTSTNEACPAVSTVGDLDDFLDPGEAITCSSTYTVTAGDVTAGFVTNIASASAGGVTSNQDSKTVNLRLPDLRITKSNNTGSAGTVGTPFNWTLTISNTGALEAVFTAPMAIVSDTLPAGPTYGNAVMSNFTNITNSGNIVCNNTAGTLVCGANAGSVTIGSGGSFQVSFAVTPTVAGALANTAVVDPGGNIPEGNEDNNTASDTVTVGGPADLALIKTASATAVQPGDTLTYTLAVTNNGPSATTFITVTDTLPTGVTFGSAGGLGWTCNESAGIVTCTRPSLSVGAAPDITIAVTVTATTGALANTATVSAATPDDNLTNNTDSETTTVLAIPNLVISKRVEGSGPFPLGDPLTFTIQITNVGSITIETLPLVDQYDPLYLGYVSASPAPSSVVPGQITWNDLGSLGPGRSVGVTTVFTAVAATTSTINSAAVLGAVDSIGTPITVTTGITVPTAVDLLYFRVESVNGSQVKLAWATAMEVDNYGFYVYRASENVNDPLHQADLIGFVDAASPGGAEYTFTDNAPSDGVWWYWLADVDTSGRLTLRASLHTGVGVSGGDYRVHLPMVTR